MKYIIITLLIKDLQVDIMPYKSLRDSQHGYLQYIRYVMLETQGSFWGSQPGINQQFDAIYPQFRILTIVLHYEEETIELFNVSVDSQTISNWLTPHNTRGQASQHRYGLGRLTNRIEARQRRQKSICFPKTITRIVIK